MNWKHWTAIVVLLLIVFPAINMALRSEQKQEPTIVDPWKEQKWVQQAEADPSCLQQYAERGATRRIIQGAYAWCKTLNDPQASIKDRSLAECYLHSIPHLQSDDGLRLAMLRCNQEHQN